MDTTIILKKEELTFDFFENIKNIYKNSKFLQISISDTDDNNLYTRESQADYFARLEKAMIDVEKSKISFTETEFDAITKENI